MSGSVRHAKVVSFTMSFTCGDVPLRRCARKSAAEMWLLVGEGRRGDEKILTFIGSVTEGDVCLNILLNNNISRRYTKGVEVLLTRCITFCYSTFSAQVSSLTL